MSSRENITNLELKRSAYADVDQDTPVHLTADDVKKRMEQISYMAGTLTDLDQIKNIVDVNSDKSIWQGPISLEKRLNGEDHDNPLTNHEIEMYKSVLQESYTETSKNAPVRCIHAGSLLGYNPDKATDIGRPLGPQFTGGTVGFSINRRIMLSDDNSNISKETFINDFRVESDAAKILGYTPGNHQGASANHEKTGCGAVDGMETILDIFIDETRANYTKELTKQLTTLAFGEGTIKQEIIDQVFNQARFLSKSKSSYLPSKMEILELVEKNNSRGAPKLDNNQNTTFLVINTIAGTTLHTDEFDYKTKNNAKAFNLDLWHIKDMARVNFDDPVDQQKFIVSSISFSIMAAMSLTDGSPRLIVRTADDINS